jgi:hypothetical protein
LRALAGAGKLIVGMENPPEAGASGGSIFSQMKECDAA